MQTKAQPGRGSGTGQRQFHVPPYPQMQGILCPHQAETKLKVLEEAFEHIFTEKSGRPSYQAMYNEVYQLMKYKYEEQLYHRIEASLESYAYHMHAKCMDVDDVAFLSTLIEIAEKYMKAVKMVSDISLYMENNCVEDRPKVNELGAMKFGNLVLKQPNVKERAKRLTTQIVQQERSGEKPPSRQLLKEVTAMMLGLKGDVYVPCLEQPFLEASFEYYRNEATALFESSSSPAYIAHVFRRLDQETDRVERCFADHNNRTLREIQRVVKDTMLVPYASKLLEKEHSGVAALLTAWRLPDLALMYQALHLIHNTEPMLERIKYVKGVGFCVVGNVWGRCRCLCPRGCALVGGVLFYDRKTYLSFTGAFSWRKYLASSKTQRRTRAPWCWWTRSCSTERNTTFSSTRCARWCAAARRRCVFFFLCSLHLKPHNRMRGGVIGMCKCFKFFVFLSFVHCMCRHARSVFINFLAEIAQIPS